MERALLLVTPDVVGKRWVNETRERDENVEDENVSNAYVTKAEVLAQDIAVYIIDCIMKAGFTVLKRTRRVLSKDEAKLFLAPHKHASYYDRWASVLSSGPCIALVVEKNGVLLLSA
jgi:nucleoside diphosphate kinase